MIFQQILALLTAKFTGVRKDALTAMARSLAVHCADEEAAKTIVDKMTDAQVNEFATEYRRTVDKEVSESNKRYEATLRKKYDFTEKESETNPGGSGSGGSGGGNGNLADLVSTAVAAAVNPLKEQLASIIGKSVTDARLSQLNEKLAGCKDEKFKNQILKSYAYMHFDNDEKFAEYLSGLDNDIKDANQSVADAKLSGSGVSPLFAQKEENGVSKGVAAFVSAQKSGDSQFAGKEL